MIPRLLALLAACAFSIQGLAQPYPSKPIKIVVGFPPGGSGDFLTRLIADEMQKALGVAVIADNRPGAGGNIAAEIVARAPADGYTVLNAPHHLINLCSTRTPATRTRTSSPSPRSPLADHHCVNNNLPVKDLKS
jgi:tripartite-type tricarboxylate transporter receptor subunit TctC